jgi:hypothetical protein
MSANNFNQYGITMDQSGKISDFSILFIFLTLTSSSLSWFLALVWNDFFQAIMQKYREREESNGRITNPIYLNFVLAMVSTLFSIAFLYLLLKLYQILKVSISNVNLP